MPFEQQPNIVSDYATLRLLRQSAARTGEGQFTGLLRLGNTLEPFNSMNFSLSGTIPTFAAY
jgi:hypothetical protein